MDDDANLTALAQLLKSSSVDAIKQALHEGRITAFDKGYINGMEGALMVLKRTDDVLLARAALTQAIVQGPPPR